MTVTCLRITRITDGAEGACVMHLEDGSTIVKSPAWAAENRPEVHGYIIDDGAKHGENWYAAPSISTLQAVLVEVQRVEAKPGELILFKLPPQANAEAASFLRAHINKVAPDLPCIITSGGNIEVVSISAQAVLANQSGAAPADGQQ